MVEVIALAGVLSAIILAVCVPIRHAHRMGARPTLRPQPLTVDLFLAGVRTPAFGSNSDASP